MSIKILKSPDKKFTPYLQRASQYFADCLISKQMQKNIIITIKFNDKLDELGFAEIVRCNAKNKPREFKIQINSNLGVKDIIMTLAHEMVHVKQFAYGETNDTLSRWNDMEVDSETLDYWFHPWEIEAHGLEGGLMTKFAVEEKLWNVFEGFKNPENKIRKSKIIWKNAKSTI
jgi:hypothetical protein